MSTTTLESDSSETSAASLDDEDADRFMGLNNDSQSSLGAVTVVHDCDPAIDLDKVYRITPISKLPPEILISIFVKLTTTADVRNCMLVCYHWALYAVAILWHRPLCNKWSNLLNVVVALQKRSRGYFQYAELVKRLNLSALSDKINDGSVQPFMDCKAIERLTLTNCSRLTDFGVANLVDGCKKLQALDVTDLSSLTDKTLTTVARNCSKLQGLNITNCSNITDESLSLVAENCRLLKRLKLNRVTKITDESVTAVARNCRSILEMDLAECESITSVSVTALLSNLPHLRELRLTQCTKVTDSAFVNLPPHLTFEALRILDLTACEDVRDEAIARIIPAAPRLRNLVLAKCRHITDRAVMSICKLTKNLHYIHLGHCVNLTDNAVIQLVKACNRIRYIDLACCLRLTDASVQHLALLPKLRRIGLVKCQNLTDASIIALARGPLLLSSDRSGLPTEFVSLERVHLSYCINLTLKGITALLHNCPRLTHLSLTGVQAFLREDLTRFCRDAPPEFTHPQRDVFCVFSGEGVQRLRDYLLRLAADEAERESRDAIDESLLDGVESPGADTMSEDGTIDGIDHPMDPIQFHQRGGYQHFAAPSVRPRPRSMHELPTAFHVDLPLFPSEQMTRIGLWTPSEPMTSDIRNEIGLTNPGLMGSASSHVMAHDAMSFDYTTRSRALSRVLDPAGPAYDHRTRSTSGTPSRRHTIDEQSSGYFSLVVPPPPPPHLDEVNISIQQYQEFDDPHSPFVHPELSRPPRSVRPGSGHLWNLGMRSAADIRQSFLRPEQDYSAFEANHEAIMATIPTSRSATRHASRSNSPHPSRVNSRSRLSNLLSGIRPSMPFSYAEAVRGMRRSRSRDQSRLDEEEERAAMWQALAEADAAQQLGSDSHRPNVGRAESEQSSEMTMLHPDLVEQITRGPRVPSSLGQSTGSAPAPESSFAIRQSPARDDTGDQNLPRSSLYAATPSTTASPMTQSLPLLLLKTRSTPTDAYQKYFGPSSGFTPTFLPVLTHYHNPSSLARISSLLQSSQSSPLTTEYDGLIFTSQRAVEAFSSCVHDTHSLLFPSSSDHSPHNDEEQERKREWQPRRKLLFFVGEQRRDVIPRTLMDSAALGGELRTVQVEEMEVYRTDVRAEFERDRGVGVDEGEGDGRKEAVAAAPAAAKSFWVDESRSSDTVRYVVATIGPTTRDFLRNSFGFEPDACAKKPSPEGVALAVADFLREKGIR
ncbi:hypothetical protein DV738_g1483, partial [Chaetothyriales sp. CBS 135597]